MQTSLNNGMCRCCASEGTFKNFTNTYHWMGEEEVYADMLKECFDISLTTSDPGEEGGICEVCITQLRNAANFKKQVLNTEQQFQRRLQDKLFKTELVKVEETCLDEAADDNSDNDNNISEDFSGPEYDLQIKAESPEEAKPKKRTAKATTSRAKKTKIDDGEPSTKRNVSPPNIEREIAERESLKIVEQSKLEDLPYKAKEESIDLTCESKVLKREEFMKHKFNLAEILRYSNATPIRSHDGIRYGCCYCKNTFISPADLKSHNIDTHSHLVDVNFSTRRNLMDYCVKLDITDLRCKICNELMLSYEMLMQHLNTEHNRTLHVDVKNQILPFKFDSETIRCYICLKEFAKFKGLLEHMTMHYRNFICPVCDRGFVNERKLLQHSESHKSVVIGDHRLSPIELRCQTCHKTFSDQRALTTHTKRIHLLERRHHCTQCDMKFFKYCELKHHMLKHTGVIVFQCDLCSKSYDKKTTLAEHMRMHYNDKKYTCEMCGQAFVQECSLKGHMKAKH